MIPVKKIKNNESILQLFFYLCIKIYIFYSYVQ